MLLSCPFQPPIRHRRAASASRLLVRIIVRAGLAVDDEASVLGQWPASQHRRRPLVRVVVVVATAAATGTLLNEIIFGIRTACR